jgi:hypothetical protein
MQCYVVMLISLRRQIYICYKWTRPVRCAKSRNKKNSGALSASELYRPSDRRLSAKLVDRLCGLVVRVPGYRSRGPGFDSRLYHIFWEVVELERGSLSLVRITDELLERKVAAPVQKTEINSRGDSLCWPRDTLYALKLALTSPTSGGRSVDIIHWRTKAPEFFFCSCFYTWYYILKVSVENNEFANT